MSRFRTVFGFELSSYLKNKVIIGVTVFLVLASAIMLSFPRFTQGGGSGTDTGDSANRPVMLIIAGAYRSRPLNAPKGMTTRPTLDQTREALFNILQGRVAEARFLDLYAGSGAVALEAVSRGAATGSRSAMARHSRAARIQRIIKVPLLTLK